MRWYRFAVTTRDAPQIRITVENLRMSGDMYVTAYDSQQHQIGWIPFAGVKKADIKSISAEPSFCYVSVVQPSKVLTSITN